MPFVGPDLVAWPCLQGRQVALQIPGTTIRKDSLKYNDLKGSGTTETLIPYVNWRGVYAGATGTDGQPCGGGSWCGNVRFAGDTRRAFLDEKTVVPPRSLWWGSLVLESADASNLLYRRNRYYDPSTGQFTQEDPIGIAGGLNVYGYADGDPLGVSDPFGLCGIPGAVGSVAVGAVLGLATGGYSLGAAAVDAGAGAVCAGFLSKFRKMGTLARAATRGESGGTTVYRSVAGGGVQYVGITNNLARRSAEHLSERGLQIEELMSGLSRGDARSVEQALIEIHGLGRNGGSLLNRINSISETNPNYAKSLGRGMELLGSIGYRGN